MLTTCLDIAISTRDTQLNVAQILAQLGGGKIALTLPATTEIPATVDVNMGERQANDMRWEAY